MKQETNRETDRQLIWEEDAKNTVRNLAWSGYDHHPRTSDEYDKVLYYAKQIPAFSAILEKAIELNWPEGFKSDVVTHDRIAIETNPNENFTWYIHPCGSRLVLDSDLQTPSLNSLRCDDERNNQHGRFFYWNGSSLIEI